MYLLNRKTQAESDLLSEQCDEWIKMPNHEIPLEKARELLRQYNNCFDFLETAALTDQCDWGLISIKKEKHI